VSLKLSANPDLSIVVNGDSDRLRQVVWNLLSNAVKFTPAEGLVDVTLTQANGNAEIIVRDTGEGIGPQFLPFVFDRFRQADGTTTRKHSGLGLGLAIVRHLMDAHGGTVTAHSDGPKTGATFTVRLPLFAGASDGTSTVPAPLAARLNGLRILVVDDEVDARDLLRVVLESAGADVTVAASGADALRLLSEQRFDVLVADIAMPEQDGYSLLRAVRALPTEAGRIPAIAVTAYASTVDRELALNVGFDRHVAKPVDPARLVAAVAGVQIS
jgi:CheY-like chemotaxis protein/anti-sigma regulatory factor (Ser/Thr protein kinase)